MNTASSKVTAMAPGEEATPLGKVAHNAATESENRIHDDVEARRLGLRGGLVPGVTLYAYLTELVLPLLGPEWLRHGACSVRFVRPVYEGDAVVCSATRSNGDTEADGGIGLDLAVRDPAGNVCVTGEAMLYGTADQHEELPSQLESGSATVPSVESRPILTRETAPIGASLSPNTLTIDPGAVEAYAAEVADPNPWYRGGSPFGLPLVPPGLLAGQPARLLRQNFSYGPSVHTASEIQHLSLALAGGTYRVGGTLIESYTKRGNDYLVMDTLLSDHTGALVVRIRHTSIFRFAARN